MPGVRATCVLVAALALGACLAPSPPVLPDEPTAVACDAPDVHVVAWVKFAGESETPAPGVQVRIPNATGGYARAHSDAAGCTAFRLPAPGTYSIEAELGCSAYRSGAIVDYSKMDEGEFRWDGATPSSIILRLRGGCDLPSDPFF